MDKKDQIKHFNKVVKRLRGIMSAKGDDYANEDRLSNFKTAGAIVNITSQQQCLSLIATKVARLGVLLKSKRKPRNESINDSMVDLTLYSILLDALREEEHYNTVGRQIPQEKINKRKKR